MLNYLINDTMEWVCTIISNKRSLIIIRPFSFLTSILYLYIGPRDWEEIVSQSLAFYFHSLFIAKLLMNELHIINRHNDILCMLQNLFKYFVWNRFSTTRVMIALSSNIASILFFLKWEFFAFFANEGQRRFKLPTFLSFMVSCCSLLRENEYLEDNKVC